MLNCDERQDLIETSNIMLEVNAISLSSLFRCAQGGCIPKTSLCDFSADCMAGDVSDEATCSAYKSGQCDFEHGLCLYSQSSDDKFDWTTSTDGTFSYGTGPSSDHTTQTNKGMCWS